MPLSPPLANSVNPGDGEPLPDDLEALKKWQEARVARKVRGEYESAVMHLSELVTTNLQTPLRVSAVRVDGAINTRQSFLRSIITPLIPASTEDQPSNLESVLHATRRINHILQSTDIFKNLEARLERSRHELAQPNDVDIVFNAREKGRYFLKTATEFGNNEGNASVTGRIRNVFGGAEFLEANMSVGTTTKRSLYGIFSAPLSSNLNTHGDISVYATERDHTSYASSSEGLRGVKATIRSNSLSHGSHEFSYEAVLRHVGGLTPTASLSMREEAGQSTKSAISHTWTLDTRDDRIAATRGALVKLQQEFAGLGGDASFFKTQGETQLSRQITSGITLSFAARSGILWGINRSPHFSDRFQLGGPMSVRSFRANGMGPRDGVDSLGGDIFWSTGVSVITDVPRKPHWPIKLQAYLNAGRLDTIDKSRPLSENIQACVSKPSVSAGLGFVYRFDPIRIELNFGVPLVASKSDGTRKGFQLGVGLDFL